MLGKVGRELIILGFIAFAVILLKELSLLHFNYDTLHVFEFCDLLVSISVLIYILNCALSSMTMSITQREWDRMAMTQTSVISEEVSSYLKGLQTSGWARFKHKMPFMAMEWRTDADFKILQVPCLHLSALFLQVPVVTSLDAAGGALVAAAADSAAAAAAFM